MPSQKTDISPPATNSSVYRRTSRCGFWLADSLFVRLILLIVIALAISHVAGMIAMSSLRDDRQVLFAAEDTAFLIQAVRQHVENGLPEPLPPRIRVVGANSPDVPIPSNATIPLLQRFVQDLRASLPGGTEVRFCACNSAPTIWARGTHDRNWIVVPLRQLQRHHPQDDLRLWIASIFATAVITGTFASWQLQRPLRSLTRAMEQFGQGQLMPSISEKGPLEFRQLTHGFNRLLAEARRAEADRSVMVAGIAHDLKSPLARLRLRAEMLRNDSLRMELVSDVESMTSVVDQFLTNSRNMNRRNAGNDR